MTDFFALEADEIKAIDALVDFLAVEHSTSEFIDADPKEILVILFNFTSAGFVAWKIFVVRFVVGTVVDVIGSAVLGLPSRAFLFCPWHFSRSQLPDCSKIDRGNRRVFGIIS